MSLFFQLIMSGISIGLVYATIALGLLLLSRAAGVMNFGQGNILAMGAFVGYYLMVKTDIQSPFLMIAVACIIFICVGIIFGAVCFLPFKRTKWPQAMMIATIGAGTVISELCLKLVTKQSKSLPPVIPGTLKIGGFVIQYQLIVIFFAMALMMLLIYIFYEKLYCGRIMSAAAQNKYTADLLGIPTNLTTLLSFCIVVMMVGFTGWLIAPMYFVRSSLSEFQGKAFAALVIGGFGGFKSAIVGGLLIGIAEALSTYVTTSYKDVVVYGFLCLVLAVRPQGLFARKSGSKV